MALDTGRLTEVGSALDAAGSPVPPDAQLLVLRALQLYKAGDVGQLQEFGIELLAVEPAGGPDSNCEPGAGPVVSGLLLPVDRLGGMVTAGRAGVQGVAQVRGERRVVGVEGAQGSVDAGGDGLAGFLGVVA